MKIKHILRKILIIVSPKLYFYFLSYRYIIINDLKLNNENNNDFSCYPTMHVKYNRKLHKFLRTMKFDDNSIPISQFGNLEYYNPVHIAQYGLTFSNLYKNDNNDFYYKKIFDCAKWFVDNQSNDGSWLYHIDYKSPIIDKVIDNPWKSAMAQGQGISLLTKAYKISKNKEYLEAAKRGLKPLLLEVSFGGLKDYFHKNLIFQEYPYNPGLHTLNGYMFCIIGLIDLFEITKDFDLESILKESLNSLENILPYYDSEYTSYYDLSHITYSPKIPREGNKYEIIHIKLLNYLNHYNNSNKYIFYIRKWSFGLLKG